MVTFQECLDPPKKPRFILRFVFPPAQTLLSQSAVEALDMSLFVLLVWPRNAVQFAVAPSQAGKLGLEFRTSVSLHDLRKSIEASSHTAMKKGRSILCGKSWAQQDVNFSAEDVDSCKSKQPTEGHSIHLNDLPWRRRQRHFPPRVVPLAFGAENVLLSQNLVDLGHADLHGVLPFQEVSDFLPAAMLFPLPDRPDVPLDQCIHLA